MNRVNTSINLNETNLFKTNYIYIKHSYLIFLISFLFSFIGVFLSRLLTHTKDNSNFEEAFAQFIFDIIHRFGYSMIITCGWTIYNQNKLKCYHNLVFCLTQILDTIISFSYWGENYAQHSTLRWNEQYLTKFDKTLARIRYSLYGIFIVLFYFFYYFPDITNIKSNWSIRTTISCFYIIYGTINLLITFGEGNLSLLLFGLQILFFIILISYDVYKRIKLKNSHTHMGILLISLIIISYYLPRLFLFAYSQMNNIYNKIIIFSVWELLLMLLDYLMNNLISNSVDKDIKTIFLFPFYFSIQLYLDFIFLDTDFFSIEFFIIFFIKFLFEIINDIGIINLYQNRIYYKYFRNDKHNNNINDLKTIKKFTIKTELNFLCERLSIFIIFIFILIDYIFDSFNIFKLNQKYDQKYKLYILLKYLFVFCMGIISNIITSYFRHYIYNHFYSKLLKNRIEEIELDEICENDKKEEIIINIKDKDIHLDNIDEILNTKFELSKWKISYSFIFIIIFYFIINAIDSSPLYK